MWIVWINQCAQVIKCVLLTWFSSSGAYGTYWKVPAGMVSPALIVAMFLVVIARVGVTERAKREWR